MPRWTDEEIATLRRTFPQGTRVAHAAFPEREPGTVDAKAYSLGLRVLNPQRGRRAAKAMRHSAAPGSNFQHDTQPVNHRARVYAHNGTSAEWGTTAGTKEGLEPVPQGAQALPWVSYPRDPQTLRTLAAHFEMTSTVPVIAKLGPEARKFYTSQAAYMRVLATNLERNSAA